MYVFFFAENNVSVTHQWPNSEMKASTSSVNASGGSHFIRDSSGITQSRVERPHSVASQGPAGNSILFYRDILCDKISMISSNLVDLVYIVIYYTLEVKDLMNVLLVLLRSGCFQSVLFYKFCCL